MRGKLDRSPLTKLEKQAVVSFVETLVQQHGATVQQVDLFGLESQGFRDTRDIQVLVLTNREDSHFEDRTMDLVLDVLLETGIYLSVKTFSKRRFQSFRKARIPMIQQMDQDRYPLWEAA